MNIKSMRRDDWSRILEKQVVIRDLEYGDFKGKVSLLKILKISSPLYVSYGERKVKIADVGHSWVQIGFENQFFWITAMFDEKDSLFEIYVDMTDGNEMNAENPCFVDMYLDYVIHDDMVTELDRDELEDALKSGDITGAQYERTISEGEKVFFYLEANMQELKELARRQLVELKKLLE